MTDDEKRLIKELALRKIDKEGFLRSLGKDSEEVVSYVLLTLKDSLILRDAKLVEYSLLLGFNIGWPDKSTGFFDILCALLREQWHYKHEDIVMLFQRFKISGCEEIIYNVANTYFEYLSYNDCEALIVKCAYALADIKTEEAIKKLRLMAGSENKIIREAGERQLKRMGVS